MYINGLQGTIVFVLIIPFAWKATYQTINIETSRNAGIVIIEPKRYVGIVYTKPSRFTDVIEAKNLRISSHNIFMKAKEASSRL